jgi:NAD(P)-dependent dehydrogenase (short-subunit alcohol dehydrogenase family)
MPETSVKNAIVTGGGRGIGAEITRAFSAAGYRVVVASRSDSGIPAELGDQVRHIACDITSPESIRAMVVQAVGWMGGVDVLVNNAGFSGWRRVEDVDEAFWDQMLSTNLKGTFFASQAVLPHLGSTGVIVNVSSLAGKRGSGNNSVYCASKFGVNGVTQAFAKELGPSGIRVNAVCPVYVETEGLMDALQEPVAPPGGQNVREYLDGFAGTQAALRRLPRGDEVGSLCLYLASDAASAVTGQCINVDCGVLPQ